MSVLIVTSVGDIVIDLFTDRCPLACKNFMKLCKIKYYNGCLFHTVQKDFTAQTGDPSGTGTGGDSIYKFLYGDQARFFGDEIHLDVKHTKTGTVAMASGGENLNASQFYITLRDDLDYLDGKHTVFGEVAEGLETLTRINEAYVDENNRPFKNIRIKHTLIIDDPFDDPSQLAELIPDASPEGKPKDEVDDDVRLEDDWVPLDDQMNPQEIEEMLRAKDAHSSAVVLETIGDIPDAELKPPDNVLFVCKLNPVTEDDDLNTIFSRFGVVTSAEVIRDHKTNDSLCYAFIEFEDKDACEQAYFKMDNALIDDRRIHVDFSQSVAKLWSQYRRKGKSGQGGGCFKCGSTDHMAKDCTGDSNAQNNSRYRIKDTNVQHGGNNNKSYDMVFEEDAERSPRHSKRRRDEKPEHNEKRDQNSRQSNDRRREDRDRDDRRRVERSEHYEKRDRTERHSDSKDKDDRRREKESSYERRDYDDKRREKESNYDRKDYDDRRRLKESNYNRRDYDEKRSENRNRDDLGKKTDREYRRGSDARRT